METWITSDMHLGSRQCRAERFCAFLERIPADVRLILNGDVMTRLGREQALPPGHAAALDALRVLSLRQEVIWIGGNHDRHFQLSGEHNIQCRSEYAIGKTLYIAHGDRFDHLSYRLRVILLPIRVIYEFCTRVAGSRTHVTDFAKLFPAVYEILNGHVVRHATAYAKERGFSAVTCGHTHHPGVRKENGVTYYNTGCWTEDSAQVLVVGAADNSLRLCPVSVDGQAK